MAFFEFIGVVWCLLIVAFLVIGIYFSLRIPPTPAPGPSHNTDDDDCWCEPMLQQRCRRCEGVRGDAACVFCQGEGWCEKWNDEDPVLVIHRTNQLRES